MKRKSVHNGMKLEYEEGSGIGNLFLSLDAMAFEATIVKRHLKTLKKEVADLWLNVDVGDKDFDSEVEATLEGHYDYIEEYITRIENFLDDLDRIHDEAYEELGEKI